MMCMSAVLMGGVWVGALSVGGAAQRAGETDDLEFREAQATARALAGRDALPPPVRGDDAERSGARATFLAALDSMADLRPDRVRGRLAARERGSIEDKLLAIAHDRRARPEIYEEVLDTYVRAPRGHRRAWQAPPLRPGHASQTYRLPLEFLLLAPLPPDSAPRVRFRARVGLRILRDPAALPTLRHCFEVSCDPCVQDPGEVATEQDQILAVLGHHATPEALHGLFHCRRHALEQQQRTGRPGIDLDGRLVEILADLRGLGRREDWAEVLRNVDVASLTPAEHTLIRTATAQRR